MTNDIELGDRLRHAICWLALGALLMVCWATGGCNTCRGVGTLISGIGQDVTVAAEGTQARMAETRTER